MLERSIQSEVGLRVGLQGWVESGQGESYAVCSRDFMLEMREGNVDVVIMQILHLLIIELFYLSYLI